MAWPSAARAISGEGLREDLTENAKRAGLFNLIGLSEVFHLLGGVEIDAEAMKVFDFNALARRLERIAKQLRGETWFD